jgi:hypothetical protein
LGRLWSDVVKYKNIDSAIHNLGHSFMSGMNYFDDDHVMYEVEALVRKEPHEVSINFSTGDISPKGEYSKRLLKSVAHYREWLGDHLRRHNVDPSALKNVTLHHRLTRLGGESVMLAVDDRGVEHKVVVRPSA